VNELSYSGAHYLADELCATGKFVMAHNQPFLNEFAVKNNCDISLLQKKFIEAGIFGGLKIAEDTLLFVSQRCVQKKRSNLLVNIVKQL